jgi:hypothetical protein
LAAGAWSAVQLLSLESNRRTLQDDAVELSKIKYGLFNVDEWKLITSRIISEKIDELDLSDTERKDMRVKIIGFLSEVIAELKNRFRAENSRGLMGFIKREGASFFGVFDQMERDIPVFADEILAFLDDPNNRADLKAYLTEKVNTYADNTFSETDYNLHNEILMRHGHEDRKEAISQLQGQVDALQFERRPFSLLIFTLMGMSLLYLMLVRRSDVWVLSSIIMLSLIALLLGVLLPMIEIDARIDKLGFQLLGEPVTFTDQVLYYKSKSILEVVELMVLQGKADLLAVGLLVLAFSVLFPLSKMLASLMYLHRPAARSGAVLRFFVFKTGKWSMADVMVVAIFMAYIGFSGILSEQLSQLEGITRDADILTTNKSSLQLGFFMFSAFVVLSLAVSQRLVRYTVPTAADAGVRTT